MMTEEKQDEIFLQLNLPKGLLGLPNSIFNQHQGEKREEKKAKFRAISVVRTEALNTVLGYTIYFALTWSRQN